MQRERGIKGPIRKDVLTLMEKPRRLCGSTLPPVVVVEGLSVSIHYTKHLSLQQQACYTWYYHYSTSLLF